jgi:hypothetical protein
MIRTTRAALAALSILGLSAHSAQADIRLSLPVDCDLGKTCYIQQFVDHDPGKGAQDFRCASLTYDTHKGTDFAVKTQADMLAGVNVIASAAGVVQATRDGEDDRLYRGRWGEVPSNRACGNGVVVAHPEGWTTQYCHLKKGSIRVQKGQKVKRGAILGQIGLSGRSEFPHVHLTVRKDKKVVDPFDPDGRIECGAPSQETLWDRPVAYMPGGILTAGFADKVPEYLSIKEGKAARARLAPDAPALVLFGYAFGGRAGDIVELEINGPNGPFRTERVLLKKNQALFFRAAGKRLSGTGWDTGRYDGRVRLIRNDRVISEERTRLTIR